MYKGFIIGKKSSLYSIRQKQEKYKKQLRARGGGGYMGGGGVI